MDSQIWSTARREMKQKCSASNELTCSRALTMWKAIVMATMLVRTHIAQTDSVRISSTTLTDWPAGWQLPTDTPSQSDDRRRNITISVFDTRPCFHSFYMSAPHRHVLYRITVPRLLLQILGISLACRFLFIYTLANYLLLGYMAVYARSSRCCIDNVSSCLFRSFFINLTGRPQSRDACWLCCYCRRRQFVPSSFDIRPRSTDTLSFRSWTSFPHGSRCTMTPSTAATKINLAKYCCCCTWRSGRPAALSSMAAAAAATMTSHRRLLSRGRLWSTQSTKCNGLWPPFVYIYPMNFSLIISFWSLYTSARDVVDRSIVTLGVNLIIY